MRLHLLIVGFLFPLLPLFGQQYIQITGTVVDEHTGKPLPFTHISIDKRGIGTYANDNGYFLLNLPESLAHLPLTASFIGYENTVILPTDFQQSLRIRMKPVPAQLPAVLVLDEASVENLIRKAVKKIPENYSTRPTSLQGFYREARSDSANQYLYLAEGVLDIYKTSYQNDEEGYTSLTQGRQIIFDPMLEVADLDGIQSGHFSGHRFDFVKHREEFIDATHFPDYTYRLEGITSYNNKPVYIIHFDKAPEGKGRMKGKIFMDTSSYAFIHATFEILPEGLLKRNDYPLYSGTWLENSYDVHYHQVGEKWYFNSALRIGKRPDGSIFSNDILITEVREGKAKTIPYSQRLERYEPFLQLAAEYDPDYWNNYNVIPLSSSLQASVRQLQTLEIAESAFDSAFYAKHRQIRDSIQKRTLDSLLKEDPEGDPEQMLMQLTGVGISYRAPFKLLTHLGAGIHQLNTRSEFLFISLADKDNNTLLDFNGYTSGIDREAILHLDFSFLFREKTFFQAGITRDFARNVYGESSWSFGKQYNLTPNSRPFFLRPSIGYSRFKYGVNLGAAENDLGKFKAGGKKLRTDQLIVHYGARTDNLKLALELALESNPDQEFFIRAAFLLPFNYQEHIYLKEKPYFWLTKRKARVPLKKNVTVTQNNEPFDGHITSFQSFLITAGICFK